MAGLIVSSLLLCAVFMPMVLIEAKDFQCIHERNPKVGNVCDHHFSYKCNSVQSNCNKESIMDMASRQCLSMNCFLQIICIVQGLKTKDIHTCYKFFLHIKRYINS